MNMSQAMPIENSCGSCGASLHEGARFCRQCGQAAPLRDVHSVTEQTTKLLDQETRPQQWRPLEHQQTAALYRGPATSPTPQMVGTHTLKQPSARNPTYLIVACIVGIFVLAATLGVAMKLLRHGMSPRTPAITVPGAPPAPPAPPGIGAPPTAPPAVAASEFVYPGSKVNLQVNDSGGIKLQLQTADSIDKVVDWYTAKLKPTKIVSPGVVIGSGGLAVLEGANGKAVITGTDEGTSVIFKGQAQ